jgi:hypothetical protein
MSALYLYLCLCLAFVGIGGLARPAGAASPALVATAAATAAATATATATTATTALVPTVRLAYVDARRTRSPRYAVHVAYPRLSGALTADERRVNATFARAARRSVLDFEHQVARDGPPPAGLRADDATLTSTVSTDLVSASYFAVTVETYSFVVGAAHGLSQDRSYDVDLATGRLLALPELFDHGSHWLALLSARSRTLLRRKLGPSTMPQMLDAGTTPVAKNFAAWALTPWGLEVTFSDYQVAAYVAGTPSIVLPYRDFMSVTPHGGVISAVLAAPPLRMALLPATTPPVVDECWTTTNYAGAVIPVPSTCSHGKIDISTWDDFADQGLRVMALPAGATAAQVRRAMCADTAVAYDLSDVNELHAEALAALYYGSVRTGFPAYCHR